MPRQIVMSFTTRNLADALNAVQAAQSRFDYATGAYVDSAVLELTAAELRLSAAIWESRSLFCPEGLDKPTNTGNPGQRGHCSQETATPSSQVDP